MCLLRRATKNVSPEGNKPREMDDSKRRTKEGTKAVGRILSRFLQAT